MLLSRKSSKFGEKYIRVFSQGLHCSIYPWSQIVPPPLRATKLRPNQRETSTSSNLQTWPNMFNILPNIWHYSKSRNVRFLIEKAITLLQHRRMRIIWGCVFGIGGCVFVIWSVYLVFVARVIGIWVCVFGVWVGGFGIWGGVFDTLECVFGIWDLILWTVCWGAGELSFGFLPEMFWISSWNSWNFFLKRFTENIRMSWCVKFPDLFNFLKCVLNAHLPPAISQRVPRLLVVMYSMKWCSRSSTC